MLIMQSFSLYTPKETIAEGIQYLRDENNNDWYEGQKLFHAETLKVVFNADDIIISAAKDVSGLWPVGASVAEVSTGSVPADFCVDGRWIFDGNGIKKKTYSASEWQSLAGNKRQELLDEANSITADWRTELNLGIISDGDKATLVDWMTYIKAVKALDLSTVKDEAGFISLIWPIKP